MFVAFGLRVGRALFGIQLWLIIEPPAWWQGSAALEGEKARGGLARINEALSPSVRSMQSTTCQQHHDRKQQKRMTFRSSFLAVRRGLEWQSHRADTSKKSAGHSPSNESLQYRLNPHYVSRPRRNDKVRPLGKLVARERSVGG